MPSTLGRSIIKARFAGNRRPKEGSTELYTTEIHDDFNKYQSITEEGDLDAFLRTAELAGTDFTAEKLNVKIIAGNQFASQNLLEPEKEKAVLAQMEQNKDRLKVPRRPYWDKDTSPEELKRSENDSFLEWRRGLEEDLEMVMTPFERNLEVWRQLWRVIERSDIVVQIVDARNPLMYRCPDLEAYVTEVDPNKKNLLLINKADFLTASMREEWALYFDENKIAYLFFSAKKASEMLENDELNTESSGLRNSCDVISAVELYEELMKHVPEGKEKITVGLVGYPNVGKSSTINALIGAKKVNVSSTPGKTKHFQTIHLSNAMVLCDCPGLVFPSFSTTKAEMVVNGVLPIDQLKEPIGPSALVAQRIPRYILEYLYGIVLPKPDESEDPDRPPTARELLCSYAVVRGFRKAGQGNPDESRAARLILKDYVNGKLLYCHPPPGVDSDIFNSCHYVEGGQKFEEALRAEAAFQSRTNNNTPVTHVVEGVSTMSVDSEFFEGKDVEARTAGRFKEVGFRRAHMYPHQSGYSAGMSVTGTMVSEMPDRGKKQHKFGKRRVKDRSWRA